MIVSSDHRGWFGPAFALVAVVTALRWALLAFDRTDLFVDETQYWLWGQEFAFGYSTKPPLIAWLIGGVTRVTGSDAPFWIRMPGAALHGVTALVLGALAARMQGKGAAIWVVAAYVTLPMAAVGSLLISTDTVMAPFFAGALFFHHRMLTEGKARDALLTGLMIGIACLAKYAGVYFLIGVALAAILRRDLRPKLSHVALLLLVWAVVLLPNVWWNLTHGLSTLTHTADNIGWIEREQPLDDFGFDDLFEFWIGQLAVVGPFIVVALLAGLQRPFANAPLAAFVLPTLIIVSMQALLEMAYANWAITAYFTGTILAMAVLAQYPRWRLVAVLSNAVICVALPVLTLFPSVSVTGKPLLYRYLGRADLSAQIISLAKQDGNVPVLSVSRDVLADLFYTGRDSGLAFYAPRPAGQPDNHYVQRYPLPKTLTGRLLLIATKPPGCAYTETPLKTEGGSYAKYGMQAYLVDATCFNKP
ncbi:MAG: glycosyltransferase family 39 protein [Paracoccaceae bacterium]